MKPVVLVSVSLSEHDCDDCGAYLSGRADIRFPDGREFSLDCDGHFGGEWDGEDESLRRIILGLAGFRFELGGEEDIDAPCVLSDEVDSSGSRVCVSAVEASGLPPTLVSVEIEHAGDDEFYPTPLRASWSGADGRASHSFPSGEWGPFWIAVADSLLDIRETRRFRSYLD